MYDKLIDYETILRLDVKGNGYIRYVFYFMYHI